MSVQTGDVFKLERTFTVEEVLQFGEISGDKGRHHVGLDEKGRLMVQGLLTASIGTQIGGQIHYIAREMICEFLRPVFTGDTITCEVIVTSAEQMEGYKKVSMKSTYYNQHEKEVSTGSSYGIIRD